MHIVKSRASLYTSTQMLKRKEKKNPLYTLHSNFDDNLPQLPIRTWWVGQYYCAPLALQAYIFGSFHGTPNLMGLRLERSLQENIRHYHCMCNLIVLCCTFSCGWQGFLTNYWAPVTLKFYIESVTLCKQNSPVSHYDLKYHLRVLYNISSQ